MVLNSSTVADQLVQLHFKSAKHLGIWSEYLMESHRPRAPSGHKRIHGMVMVSISSLDGVFNRTETWTKATTERSSFVSENIFRALDTYSLYGANFSSEHDNEALLKTCRSINLETIVISLLKALLLGSAFTITTKCIG